MIKALTILLAIVTLASARPKEEHVPMNMVTVPTNCPEGQQLINGKCRDIWIHGSHAALKSNEDDYAEYKKDNGPRNMITVPVNCPEGQELVNGVCRDIWRLRSTSPIPAMVEDTENELLTKIVESIKSFVLYRRNKRQVPSDAEQMLQLLDEINTNRNIITVPNQCPAGYKPDILGICRPIFD